MTYDDHSVIEKRKMEKIYWLRSDVNKWERYIAIKWNAWTEEMRQLAMTHRSEILKELLELQLKEFSCD